MGGSEYYEAPEQGNAERKRANLISNLGMVLSVLPMVAVLLVAFRFWNLGGLEWVVWVAALPVAFAIFFGGMAVARATDKPYYQRLKEGKFQWLQEHYGSMFTEDELRKLADYSSVDKTVDGVQQHFSVTNGGTKKTMRRYHLAASIERQSRVVTRPTPLPVTEARSSDGLYHAAGADS